MQGLLQLIEAERRSDTVNRLLLQHLLRMLTALGIYEDAFQVRWSGYAEPPPQERTDVSFTVNFVQRQQNRSGTLCRTVS